MGQMLPAVVPAVIGGDVNGLPVYKPIPIGIWIQWVGALFDLIAVFYPVVVGVWIPRVGARGDLAYECFQVSGGHVSKRSPAAAAAISEIVGIHGHTVAVNKAVVVGIRQPRRSVVLPFL